MRWEGSLTAALSRSASHLMYRKPALKLSLVSYSPILTQKVKNKTTLNIYIYIVFQLFYRLFYYEMSAGLLCVGG